MIGPETNHHFVQLPLTIHRAKHRGRSDLVAQQRGLELVQFSEGFRKRLKPAYSAFGGVVILAW